MHHENFVVDECPKRQMPVHLINKLQKPVGIMPIFLMNLAGEAITVIHYSVFVISTVQHDTAGENDKTGEKDEQNFQAFLATIHKVTVEHVMICVRR